MNEAENELPVTSHPVVVSILVAVVQSTASSVDSCYNPPAHPIVIFLN